MISEILKKYDTDKNKRNHMYGRVYDSILRPFDRNAKLDIAEIGVLFGESIRAWRECFPNANLMGIDILDNVENKLEDVEYVISDVRRFIPEKKFDIVIDDGSHKINDIMFTVKHFQLKVGGVMIIEDCNRPYLLFEKLKKKTKYSIECIDLREVGSSKHIDDFLIVLRNYGYYEKI